MDNLIDFFRSQNHVFFDALGESHTIDSMPLSIVVDNAALKRREDKAGIHLGELMYYAQLCDFTRPPQVGEVQVFDGRAMVVEEVTDETGMLRIVLSQNRG